MVDDKALETSLTNALEQKSLEDHAEAIRKYGPLTAKGAGEDNKSFPKKMKVSGHLINDVLRHVRSQSWLELEYEPTWLDDPKRDARYAVAFRNGILDLGRVHQRPR